MLVIGGPESPIEVRGLVKYPSHGGSQGFKSPHLHHQHQVDSTRMLVPLEFPHRGWERLAAVPALLSSDEFPVERRANGEASSVVASLLSWRQRVVEAALLGTLALGLIAASR